MANWKDLFDFNKRERNGSLFLLFILFLIILSYLFLPFFIKKEYVVSEKAKFEMESFVEKYRALNDSLEAQRINSYAVNFNRVDYSVSKQALTPFEFNPNKMSESDWKRLGLSDWQVKSIQKYTQKGGTFRTNEDFRKMYAISDDDFDILEPYIVIPADSSKFVAAKPQKVEFRHEPIDLNKADTFDLRKIPGIGVALSRRIFNYRERLGGFYDASQLFEVYGMDSARVEKVTPYLSINDSEIRKININKADVKELLKHPYIDYYIAKSIDVHRQQFGRFNRLEELKEATLMYDELFNKLKPYLSLE